MQELDLPGGSVGHEPPLAPVRVVVIPRTTMKLPTPWWFFDSATRALNTVIPVSYTHLDVYKRQGMSSVATMRHLPASLGDSRSWEDPVMPEFRS